MNSDMDFTYTGARTSQISFPLGGIGTGSIGLAGNGRLIDWEIFNRPSKLSFNGFSFFAVKAECGGEVKLAKVLNGDLQAPYTGEGKGKFEGYGYGPRRENMAGFPHFAGTSFRGKFPVAEMMFDDAEDPVSVKLTAFNPFIPLNDKDSSIPCAIFEYEVYNRSEETLEISLVGNVSNPFRKGAVNEALEVGGRRAIRMSSVHYEADDAEFGDLTLMIESEEVSYQSYWYRGGWFDNLTVFWKDFSRPGRFQERRYEGPRELDAKRLHEKHQDVGLLSGHRRVAPGETATFRFVLAWSFPNCVNFWNPGSGDNLPSWKNYYSTLFRDSTDAANYVMEQYDRLYTETRLFQETLFRSTLPAAVLDAVSSNISILKSPTVLRLTDGTLYGFEGVHTNEGSCEGSCTHVWNYEQATAFLFPALARSMRNIDYAYAQFENGKMAFRLMLPPERTTRDNKFRAAADGQMGGIIKTYREWKISGDTEWLRSIWPRVRQALEYAWDPANEDRWDADKDGVMEGRQHHTLDMELFGPNSWLTSMYLTALKAAAEMAGALGEPEKAAEYEALWAKGAAWTNEHLFNGRYFHQLVDLKDRSVLEQFGAEEVYWNDEAEEHKYQIGEGCGIDQVLGQWFAHLVGLGYVLDPVKVKRAVQSIYEHNYIENLRDYPNACRIYGLNDEAGLVICTWPDGNGPTVPVPYADECMNGFEYQAACHMIHEGLVEEGLRVVKSIRDRYDGQRRNPWNEFECGSNYARSMASYGLLLALSGFEYDMVNGHIGFNPRWPESDFRCFWSLNEGWGEVRCSGGKIELEVMRGELRLSSFGSGLLLGRDVKDVTIGGNSVSFERSEGRLAFRAKAVLVPQTALVIQF
ncbi:GH116 family glycosyl-hydrolase [Gordoniibacillus kamchatkensis]|uniref:GH116 family glycosyl-hydrolase n=1 Tax=Gordoniibacillus kamchatkensis TaxID=1590651 RepID=UPI0006978E6A|nr:GH116 family glycosyl-hydrolase [Paenibacillus sp. VKM B-2647]